jgi:CHAD domain-containing protein
MTPLAPFTHPSLDLRDVMRALGSAGVAFRPAAAMRRTQLDTADERLRDAGLRLEAQDGAEHMLVLTGGGAVDARLAVPPAGVPRFLGDLPAGPFRARLAPVIEVRALLPRAAIDASRTVGEQRNREGKVVVRVVIDDQLAATETQTEPTTENTTKTETAARAGGLVPRWTVVVEELTGYAAAAHRTRELLEALGLTAAAPDPLAALAAKAPKAHTSSPTIPLDARARAGDGYRLVFHNLLDAIDANVAGTIDDIDPEFLHDFRVAVRRTRSVLKKAKHVIAEPVRERYRAEFGWLAGATSAARDLDVYVTEWDSYVAPLAEDARGALTPVLDYLRKHRAKAHKELNAALRSRRYGALLRDWRRTLDDAEEFDGRDADARLGKVVAKQIQRAQDQVLDQGRAITDASPGTDLHELRKDAKLLRYLIECFGGMYPAAARKPFVKELKALQDNLGSLQDAEVHIAELRDASEALGAKGTPPSTLLAMGQLTEHLERRRAEARAEFADRFARYDTKETRRALKALLAAASASPEKA